MRRFLLCIGVFAWFAVSGLALADDSTSTTTAVPTEATAAETSADGATAEAAPAPLPKPQPLSLDELLEMVRLGFASEREENRQRERDFLARKEDQAQLLSEAEAVLGAARSKDSIIRVGHIHLYSAAWEALKREARALGPLRAISTVAGKWGPFNRQAPVLWE